MRSAPSVHIVIINWNNWQFTSDCLDSLRALTYPCFRVTVVDNASSDDSLQRLRQIHPDVTLLAETTNWGFAEGNNIGLRAALAQGADYIWILNNDTVVAHDSLTLLVEAMEADTGIGAAGPKIYFADPPDKIWFAGAAFNPLLGKPQMRGYGETDDAGRWETNQEADFITGCAALLRGDVLHDIGLLDPDYFFIAEDLDLGLRIRASGCRNLVVPAAHIWHRVSASSGGEQSPLNIYYAARNRLLLMKKRGRALHWPVFALHFLASTPLKYLIFSLTGKGSFACFRAACLAMKDFALGRVGAAPPATQVRISRKKPQNVTGTG